MLPTLANAATGSGFNAVAGLQPDRRPVAPKITSVIRDDRWYANAFAGIQRPYPWTLQFIDEQGNWYTPFSHPGMTGRYDIRGWHKPE
jgi:hypothetical protein